MEFGPVRIDAGTACASWREKGRPDVTITVASDDPHRVRSRGVSLDPWVQSRRKPGSWRTCAPPPTPRGRRMIPVRESRSVSTT